MQGVAGLDVVTLGAGVDELVGEGLCRLGRFCDQSIDRLVGGRFVNVAEDAAFPWEREGVEEGLDVHDEIVEGLPTGARANASAR